MSLPLIDEVLFAGLEAADFAGVGGTSTSSAYRRTGTVAAAFQGPLTIPLPRKVAYPEILCIHATCYIPSTPTTGWQGSQIFSLRDGEANKLGLHMFGNAPSNGNGWHYWNGSNQKTNLFGNPADVYGGLASLRGDLLLPAGSLSRRTWSIRYDAVNTTSPANQMVMEGMKAGWTVGSTSAAASGISTLGGSTGIDSIVLGYLNGAWWSEIIVTVETAFPTLYTMGGHSLYAITDTRPDLAHPYGTLLTDGNPGDGLRGYPGVVDGYTWAWQLQAEADPYVLVYGQEVEVGDAALTGNAETVLDDLTSSASGVHITGTASAILDAATSSASGTVSCPGFGQRIALMGTLRPTKTLNATWVPR